MSEASPLATRAAIVFARCMAPRRHREWIEAAIAELAWVAPPGRTPWTLGLLFSALRLRACEPSIVYALVATCLCLALVVVDWSTASDILTLGALLIMSASLGYLRPDRVTQSTVAIGTVLLAAHALANFTRSFWPFYQCKALAGTDYLVLATLIVPALAGTRTGAILRSIIARER